MTWRAAGYVGRGGICFRGLDEACTEYCVGVRDWPVSKPVNNTAMPRVISRSKGKSAGSMMLGLSRAERSKG